MPPEAAYTLAILATMVVALAREAAPPDLVILAGLLALAAPGLITPAEAFAGFANPAVATVGALFVVSAGLRETGLLDAAAHRLFRGARSPTATLLRLCPPLAAASAVLNNAPIVALMTPVVQHGARAGGQPASRFLIPLAYATVLGSALTVIGTSVNLVVAGLLTQNGLAPMGFFELLPVGLPVALAGLAYLVLVAPRLLPARREPALELGRARREYTSVMRVAAHCGLIGQSVEQAGLRQLPGLFLVEIERQGHTLTPVGPEQRLEAGDALVFAGVVETIVDLQRIPGLLPDVVDDGDDGGGGDGNGGGDGRGDGVGGDGGRGHGAGHRDAHTARAAAGTNGARAREKTRARERGMMEAVVSSSSPLVGRSIRDANFRTTYDAAVLAVHRNGERVRGKIGEIVLRQGDTLLLQTAPGFSRVHKNSPDFYLVSELADAATMPRREKGPLALAILGAMVVSAALGWLPISIAALLAAGALIACGVITPAAARKSVAWSVLVIIGAGFGLARAMQNTGAADALASALLALTGSLGPLAMLAAIYLATLLLAELLHHNAAAALMAPIALASATAVGAEPRTFVLTVAIAATCAFANPTTYQAHLIVYGPGGYKFTDFVRVGLPLNLLAFVVAMGVIPVVWGV